MQRFDLRIWPDLQQSLDGQQCDSFLIDQIVIDSRRITTNHALFVPLEGHRDDGHRFLAHAASMGARFALVKKNYQKNFDLPLTLLRVDHPVRAFQNIVHFYRKTMATPILAIGGSYGKTMLKDLLYSILKDSLICRASPESFNSQIGVPLSIINIDKKDQIALIEAGISKIGEMQILSQLIEPDFAIITQIKETHLSTLKDLNTITQEVVKLAERLPADGWLLAPSEIALNTDLQKLKVKKIFWNQNCSTLPHAELVWLNDDALCYQVHFPDGTNFEKTIDHGLPYLIDIINMGVKAAWLLGISIDCISAALDSYIPESMQTEVWTSPQGAIFINDIYSEDPISIGKALKNLPETGPEGRKIFFFDGLKNQHLICENDLKHIGEEICDAKINQLILVGNSDYTSLIKKIVDTSPKTEIALFVDRKEAFKQMRSRIKRDDLILLKGARKEKMEDLAKELTDIVKDTRLTINLAAIRSNIDMIRTKLPSNTRIMAMVKAFAYGTDQIIIGKFLKRCSVDILGVAHVDEAIALRLGGVEQALFVINTAVYEVTKLVNHGFEVGVSDLEIVQALGAEAICQGRKIKVHLHIDTGMSRLGCRPCDALAITQSILKQPNLELAGIMTHFASAEDPEQDEFSFKQIATFKSAIDQLHQAGIDATWIHAANSSASVRFDLPFCNMVRVGLALYGLQSSEATRNALKLRMALSFKSKIAGINNCIAGDSISYGRTYIVKNNLERIGVIPVGYFDGLHRHYSGKGYVMVRGYKAPMVGTICMDFMMINISEIPHVKVGDNVLLFGEDEYGHYIAPEEFAARGNTTPYELITCLGPRIQRFFIDDEK